MKDLFNSGLTEYEVRAKVHWLFQYQYQKWAKVIGVRIRGHYYGDIQAIVLGDTAYNRSRGLHPVKYTTGIDDLWDYVGYSDSMVFLEELYTHMYNMGYGIKGKKTHG